MINIKMLGEFTLEYNGVIIGEPDNRQKKIWILLAYLIYNRDKKLTVEDVYEFLWENPDKVTNTVSAVKTTVHRLRSMIEKFGKGLGIDILTYENKGYQLNPSYEYSLDVEQFLTLLESEDTEEKLKALYLYDNDFLVKFINESKWIKSLADSYHEKYVNCVNEICPVLLEENRLAEIYDLCKKAVTIDPLNEELYRNLMNSMILLDKNDEAVRTYEHMSKLFIESYGKLPSDEASILYKKAHTLSEERIVPIDELCDSLAEPVPATGAFLMEYDFFKTIYQIYARTVSRLDEKYKIGFNLGLITVREPLTRKLRDKSMDIALENLQIQILSNIRKGDAVTKCSNNQFVLLLPDTNYDQAKMVCERIKSAFFRQHPHSPVELHISVQPVKPAEQVVYK